MTANKYPFGVGRLPAPELNDAIQAVSDSLAATQATVDSLGASKPIFQGRLITTPQNLGTNSWDDVGLNTEDYDTAGGHDNSTNNARYTPTVAGIYRVWGATSFDSNSTGYRGGRISRNGTAVDGGGTILPAVNGSFTVVPVAPILVTMNGTTDYVTLQALSSVASRQIPVTSSVQSFLAVEYVRPT